METELDITSGDAEPEPMYRWQKADPPLYREELQSKLAHWPRTTLDIPGRMDQGAMELITAIQDATRAAVPTITTKYAVAGFNAECKELIADRKRIRRQEQEARSSLGQELDAGEESQEEVQGGTEGS